jgi:excisionase family DNA binding protein
LGGRLVAVRGEKKLHIPFMPTKATEPKFSIEQVAKILGGLHPTTVLRLLQKRKLGYYQFGSRKLVGQSHLDNYVTLAEREAKAKSIH